MCRIHLLNHQPRRTPALTILRKRNTYPLQPLHKAFHDVFSRNLRSESVLYYVAESDGAIVGFGSLHIELLLHHLGLAGEIQELVVHETVRSKGIGAELVSRLEEEAEKQGCVAIEVTTRKRWVDAQRFYERVGFRKTHVNFTKDLITQGIS